MNKTLEYDLFKIHKKRLFDNLSKKKEFRIYIKNKLGVFMDIFNNRKIDF
jgi:hypothetical protein